MYRFAILVVCSFACAGCGGTPSQAEVEKTVRDGMKATQGVEVEKLTLAEQGGGYVGTATATNGDTYDVTVSPPKRGRFQWNAVASQATVERILREKIERTHQLRVVRLELAKESPGAYTGTVELEDGTRWKVSTSMMGSELKWQADRLP